MNLLHEIGTSKYSNTALQAVCSRILTDDHTYCFAYCIDGAMVGMPGRDIQFF